MSDPTTLPYLNSVPVTSYHWFFLFAAAGLTYTFSFRRPGAPRDLLLMFFPIIWVVGLFYLYVAKLDIYFALTPQGASLEGLPVGNLLVVGAAILGTLGIIFISHPVPSRT